MIPEEIETLRRLTRQAFTMANAAALADIKSECVAVELDGCTWWDTRPMTDPREHSPAAIEMATLAIQYAVGSGLASVHPQRPYLLTLNG